MAYMAPEVLAKRGYHASVDWWSLGVVCFELMFGKVSVIREMVKNKAIGEKGMEVKDNGHELDPFTRVDFLFL